MLKKLLSGFLCSLSLLSAADYTAVPLRPRTGPAAGGKAFTRLDSAKAGLVVPNRFDDPRMWGNRFRELTLGAVETGVAVADFNRDGRPDIFAISKNGPCALYIQTVDFQFQDVAAAAGVAVADGPSSNTGVTVVDINQDGWPDLYICRYDLPNLLFINNGDGTFTERAHEYGLDIKDASVHATFADYDRDGHLDCYLVTNILDFSISPTSPPRPASGASRRATRPSGSTPTTTAGPTSTSPTTSRPPTASTSTRETAPSPTSSTSACPT
jgi:hypothetical protein